MSARARRRTAGFTLVEIMIALAILGLGLTILLRSIAASSAQTPEVQAMGVATALARGKMLDVEEQLLKDGFLDTDQSSEGDFDAEGWPEVTWVAKVEIAELPSLDAVMALQEQAQARAEAEAAGQVVADGSGGTSFGDSTLGGVISLFGGGFGGGSEDTAALTSGASLFYPIIQDVFKASLRKVTLTVRYQVLGRDREFDTVAFFTDPAGLSKTIGQFGASAAGDDGNGTGTGGSSGTGTGGSTGGSSSGSRNGGGRGGNAGGGK
ncbi:MAG: prepilin-type N-terminal cleavage/methylation domain-containing protein [Kofleriaceae bacterium]